MNISNRSLSKPTGVVCTLGAAFFGVSIASGQGPDVKVNQDPAGRCTNETSIVQNLINPQNFVMAFNDDPYAGTAGLGVCVSNDGGVNWVHSRLAPPPGMVDCFDPITAVDARGPQGTLFAGSVTTSGAPGGQSAITLWYSQNSGTAWAGPYAIAFDPTNLLDKPHLCADVTPASPFLYSVYAAWIRDWAATGPWSDISFAWNRVLPPLGAFSAPIIISDAAPGTGMGNGPNVAIGVDGWVYVSWTDCDVTQNGNLPGTIYLDRSANGGVTWGTDVTVQNILTIPDRLSDFQAPLQDAIARSYTCLEASPTNPNVLYMVYAADPDGPLWPSDEANVYFTRSIDRGLTWSAPLDVSATYLPFSGGHEFEPWIDVKPGGVIDLAFYAAPPNDLGMVVWDVLLMRSADGGLTWSQPLIVNDTPFVTPTNPWGTPWMGEYLGLVVDATNAYVGFTSSVSDAIGDVYFDTVPNSAMPLPCPWDFDGNASVGFLDLNMVLSAWGTCPAPCPEDFDGDGNVGFTDLNAVLTAWGLCP